MHFEELIRQLKTLGVKPKDNLRASLYIDYLEQLEKHFRTPLENDFKDEKYAFVQKAVTSANLLNELAEVLDFFVAPAVAADLKRAYPPAGPMRYTYREYFDLAILHQGPTTYRDNLKRFRKMYPITDHALNRLCNNFRNNIVEMCDRVFADRELLIEFYKDLYNNSLNINFLAKIQSTGSDFHKGG